MLGVKGKIPHSIYILKEVASNPAGILKACRDVKSLALGKCKIEL